MKIISKILVFIMFVINLSCNFSDNEKGFIRKGNKLYKKDNFEEAEIQYRKAIDEKPSTFKGTFNLSDATYKQQKFKETQQLINQLKENTEDKKNLGMLYHNEGNTYLSSQKINEAIESYKNSLRKNPTDKETKYNLEYARYLRKKMQNQQQQNKEQNKNSGQEQQQNKDKEQQQKNQDQQKQEKNQQSQGISKENAERILEALLQDEKKTKEKMEKEKLKKQKVKVRNPKDW